MLTNGNDVKYILMQRLVPTFNLHNHNHILVARDEGRGNEAIKILKEEGLKPEFHQLDILSAESIEKFKSHLEQKHGGLDVLVNNAGIAYSVVKLPCS